MPDAGSSGAAPADGAARRALNQDGQLRDLRARAILESAVDFAIITTDRDGLITGWNRGAEEIFGWSAAEMLGLSAELIFTPEDRLNDRPAIEIRRALESGRAGDERWHVRKDDARFWAVGELMPLRSEDGAHLGFLKILRDRTEQRKAREKQRADAEFLRRVLASSRDCIAVLNLDATLAYMSEGSERMLEGNAPGVVLGRAWPDLWRQQDRLAVIEAVETARGGGTGRFRGAIDRSAGTPDHWDVQVTPILDGDGRPETLLVVSRDVTATRLAEEALREAQGLNTLILNSSRDCIVVLDLDGNNLLVSPGGIEAMEIEDVDAILGLSWLRVWRGADHVAARAAVAEARAGGVGRFQGLCPTHKGTPKWWDVVISPLPGPDGRPERLVSVGRDITEAKQAEQRLARSEERLSLALGAAGMVGIWDWDLNADVVFADANFARIYGVDPAAAAEGAPFAEYSRNFHPEDMPAFQAALDRLFAGAADFDCEYRVRQQDGSVRWLLGCGRLVRDEEGTPVRFPGTCVDITARKQADIRRASLLDLGDRLRDLEDIGEMAFVAAEIMGRTLGVSAAGYATMDAAGNAGIVERDWTGPGIASIAGRHRMEQYGTYVADLCRGEAVVIADTTRDSRTAATAESLRAVAVRALVNLPLLEHGRLVAFFFVLNVDPRAWTAEELIFLRNVAERTRSAIERRRAERSLQELAASLERQVGERTRDRDRTWRLSQDLLAVVENDALAGVNAAWTKLLGWEESTLMGSRFADFAHPDDLEAARAVFEGIVAAPLVERCEFRLRHRDGTYRWFAWTAAFEDGRVYATGRDVSAEKEQAEALHQAEEQLRQSQKMEAVGQLTGGLAHDFNNLLTGITGSLELLQTRVAQGRLGDVDRYVTAAQGAAGRAAALTHRLLAFSRRQTLDPKPTQANRLISDMEELIRQTVGPEIMVETVLAIGLWPTLCDPNQLENAVLNLCINARDAMPGGGRLTIETANSWLDGRCAGERDMAPGQYVAICVTDTGTGMPPEVIARAFDPFFTTKPLGQGTGLGLSMIYGFARQSGGQVRIYSEVSKGTAMRIYLPRHWAEEDKETPTAELDGAPRAQAGETVLIVDDEPTVRMLVAEVLEELGYAAIEAGDGVAGLKVLNSDTRIDLLITDVGLPGGMNGRQMADAGRQTRPDLKVLFITGYAENAVVGNGHLGPGMHLLTKPFAMERLASRIKGIIAGS